MLLAHQGMRQTRQLPVTRQTRNQEKKKSPDGPVRRCNPLPTSRHLLPVSQHDSRRSITTYITLRSGPEARFQLTGTCDRALTAMTHIFPFLLPRHSVLPPSSPATQQASQFSPSQSVTSLTAAPLSRRQTLADKPAPPLCCWDYCI